MKRAVILGLLLIISFNVFASGSMEDKVLKHPLVKSFDYEKSDDDWGCSFTVKLKNGHEIYFKNVKSDLTFGNWGGILHINNVYFFYEEYKKSSEENHYYLRLNDLYKATGKNFKNVYSVLDNYNEFCKLLNSIPWKLDENAEKLCAKYSDAYYIYLYRGDGILKKHENIFIEIPKDLDYENFGRETFDIDFSDENTKIFK